MKQYGFGVDIGGTTCKIGIFETSGNLLEKWEIPTRTENHGEHILSDVTASIFAKMQERGITKEEVQGIGMGVPGPVTAEGVVLKCANLGWEVFDVAKDMQARTGCRVKVANDANVAALGEMWQGGAKGYQNVVMVTLGTGVGGGIIIDGNMVYGCHGVGGEIGHIRVNPNETAVCGCGKRGCLEQYASATGIVRLANLKLKDSRIETVLRKAEPLTAKDVFDAAKEKDAAAEEVIEEMAKILGNALANIACVVNPEIFLIGGGVSKAGTILTEKIQTYFEESAFHTGLYSRFALAALGNDAGMYGCVKMLLE